MTTRTIFPPRAWADPDHHSNKLRPRVRCAGCDKPGCVTYWGPWCFACNVERMDRINGKFEEVAMKAELTEVKSEAAELAADLRVTLEWQKMARTEIERLRAALKRARDDINDYGLDDFEDSTHETLAVIDAALGDEQSAKLERCDVCGALLDERADACHHCG